MASAAVKMAAAVLCMLVALSVAGQLTTAVSTSTRADHVVDQELALLDDGGDTGAGATICPSNCQKCLVKCAGSCVADIVIPPTFVACFLKCAVVKPCFAKI